MLNICLFLAGSYLFGSISAGYLLFRLKAKRDIRQFGSHNIGATNVLRTAGWKLAFPVALFDIFKGFIPVFLALRFFDDARISLIVGFLAVLGHCFPVFLGFKGGKGVSTTVGVYLALSWPSLLCILGIFFLVVLLTRFISLGSLLASLAFPVIVYFMREPIGTIILGGCLFLIILFKHRENIVRLKNGSERKFGEGKA